MNKTVWTIVGALAVVASAIIVIASFAIGGCDHMLETATSGSCWMKCHWTFVAAGFTGIAAVASSVLAVLGKTAEGRRNAAVTTVVVAAIVIFFTLDAGIGLCGNAAMHCHQTALVVRIAAAVAIVCGIAQVAGANPEKANVPKMKL